MRPRLRAGHGARDEDRGRALQLLRLRRHERDARVPPLPLTPSVLVDGSPTGSIAATDRGLAFGDGVFRTIAVRAGRPLNWTWHYRRLSIDCALLGIAAPNEALVASEVAQVARDDATVKVIVSRGAGGRGYAIDPAISATRVVAAFPSASHDPARARDGVAVRRCTLVASEQPRLAGAKTLNRLESVLARGEWDDPAIAEGLLADAGGRVIAGTMSNLFVVKRGRIATPELSRCGVVGAQRERVRELLGRAGVDCEVRDIGSAELEEADEIFLTNSLIGAWPVAALGARRWSPGALTRRVQALIAEHDARA